MILYHGSFVEISKPDLIHSRSNVDFGRGFYVTPLHEQVEKWCGKFKRRGKDGIISRCEYDEGRKVELTIIDKMEAINRLRYEKPNLQICFRTEKALSLLHFEGSEIL
ncbi:MAG: DUF3990 domain-containing protein [Dorea sp.]|nr:DUF3990 domain-containing protein [Dorea sp.]